jgi:hypothetical protein
MSQCDVARLNSDLEVSMRISVFLLVGVIAGLSASGPARAEGDEVTVKVGETKRVDAGYAHGLRCDDLSVADVDLKTDEKTGNNDLVVTGKKEGSTACRVGIAGTGPTKLVKIKVERAGK